jgi:hypothetical protein
MSERFEFTLVDDARHDTPPSTRRLATFRAMPLTASSELRASADLRRLSDRLITKFPHLQWYEVLCQPAVPPQEQDAVEIPAVALLDTRVPILICLYDSSAFFSVDAELTRLTARRAFRSAASYVGVLRESGYGLLVDHETGAVGPLSADLSRMTTRLLPCSSVVAPTLCSAPAALKVSASAGAATFRLKKSTELSSRSGSSTGR